MLRVMGTIGASELIILALIVLVLVVPVVVAIRFVAKHNAASADLVPCRACGRQISPRADRCPQCGEPREPLHE
jgi:hypothetical protein